MTGMLLAPGGEIGFRNFHWYADIEFPIFQILNGNQLTTPYLIKTIFSYDF